MAKQKSAQCVDRNDTSGARCELRFGHLNNHEVGGVRWPRVSFVNGSARGVLEGYRWDLERGHPWLPGAAFKTNPDLGDYILGCLESWVEGQ